MKIEDARQNYYELSEKASNVGRQLAFAGLALLWILRNHSAGDPARGWYELAPPLLPPALVPAAFWFIVGLTADLLHYASATLIWGSYSRRAEKKGKKEVTPSRKINWPADFLMCVKLIAFVWAYVHLFKFAFMHLPNMSIRDLLW